jgi:hypothetical protein
LLWPTSVSGLVYVQKRPPKERYPDMIFLKLDPTFDRLHGNPRFADLVRRIGLG